jgi:hypothetical protein
LVDAKKLKRPQVFLFETGFLLTPFLFPTGAMKGIFLFATASRPVLRPTQSPIQWEPHALFWEIKRLGCETDHSHPCRVEVKNVWSYISTPQYVFLAW